MLTISFPQPVGAHVEGAIELHNIYLGPDNLYRAQRRSSKLTTTGYHSDVSYEHQPPGITILTLLAVPSTGGDTGWVSQVAAYDRLSDPIKKLLEGLRAEHSGFPQAEGARRDGKFVRREPVKSEHPIVRIHPVTPLYSQLQPKLTRFLGNWPKSALHKPRLHKKNHWPKG
jgi:sulfonate dioxygenase